jgi:hypothetical protein
MINLDPLGNIGEFLGATAVVISLLYLARQVSQNTDYIRASNYRALAEAVNQLNRLILESASLPRLIVAAAQGREAFSDEDWIRYSAFINQAALTFELALYFHTRGMYHEPGFEAYRQIILDLLASPAGQDWWSETQETWNAELRAYLNEQLVKAA